jgi:hypothetical protein
MKSTNPTFSESEYSFLASLGLSFDMVPNFDLSPENGLISLLNKDEFIGNYMYGMLKLFLKHHHSGLRIDLLVQNEKKLSPMGRATLSALANFCSKDLKDSRFKKIKKFKLNETLFINTQEYVDSVGAEPYLLERGIVVRVIPIQNEKKIRPAMWLLKNNIWFRNRLIFGLGVRADAFSVLQTGTVKTYYELSKILGSSLFSARKNFQDFMKLKQIGMSEFV